MTQRAVSDYIEATDMKVLRPQLARAGKSFDTWITASSPLWQRIAVVQLTRYLCLEHSHYRQDFDEYATPWEENRTATFTITSEVLTRHGLEREALVGILTFHQFKENPILYQCYLHPFFRGRGHMVDAWQAVQGRFPRFEVESPISPAMNKFLQKVDTAHVLPST
jgi:hypothetical protein